VAKGERFVECGAHGRSDAAFVCKHLVAAKGGPMLGFHQAKVDPRNREWSDLNGWCDQCEQVYLAQGEWNGVSEGFAGVTLICSRCFFDMKARHGGLWRRMLAALSGKI
jgi:hypothetical protein